MIKAVISVSDKPAKATSGPRNLVSLFSADVRSFIGRLSNRVKTESPAGTFLSG